MKHSPILSNVQMLARKQLADLCLQICRTSQISQQLQTPARCSHLCLDLSAFNHAAERWAYDMSHSSLWFEHEVQGGYLYCLECHTLAREVACDAIVFKKQLITPFLVCQQISQVSAAAVKVSSRLWKLDSRIMAR